MRAFLYLYRYYRKGGYRVIPAVKKASRVWNQGF